MASKKTSSPCHQGMTPPDSPTKESTTPRDTVEDLKHLFESVLLSLTNREPPNTPVFQDHSQSGPDMVQLKQLLVKVIRKGYSSAELPVANEPSEPSQPCFSSDEQAENAQAARKDPNCFHVTSDDFKSFKKLASASQFKTVAETWDKLAEPTDTSIGLDDYAEYAFIARERVDRTSSSIQTRNSTVFTSEVLQRFLEIMGKNIGYHTPVHQTMDTTTSRVKRRKGNAPALSVPDGCLIEQNTDNTSGSTEMVPLRIGDAQNIMSYYEGALKHFQQRNCSTVAKAFVKFIEPRKRILHPYNGRGSPRGSAPRTTGDPEMTKPEWWPEDIIHKEPDHLRIKNCIKLLLHIICKLGYRGITADKLKDVASETQRSLKDASDVEIMYEILRVRKMEESFERGEVDANMVVYTMRRGPSLKADEEDEPAISVTTEKSEHLYQGLMNPNSSFGQPSTSLTTHIDNIPSTRSLPDSFSMVEPLNLEIPIGQDCPYYTVPQYSGLLSQPMLSTPVTAEMISPHNVPVSASDYSAYNTYPNSTPGVSGHCDTWTPSFHDNIQCMPQPLMKYQIPTVSHVQYIACLHPPELPLCPYGIAGPPAF
ncbi:uncharacterized protein N7479_001709 [Penicillium vulpinum]|nr:uncharacterized protein N7479_001709 [Penicillium vulpinum]KAJ5971791.1 hypothetical protein N7479_001709 [Penicillium vulpinum]